MRLNDVRKYNQSFVSVPASAVPDNNELPGAEYVCSNRVYKCLNIFYVSNVLLSSNVESFYPTIKTSNEIWFVADILYVHTQFNYLFNVCFLINCT